MVYVCLSGVEAVNADLRNLGTAHGDPERRHPPVRQLDSKAPGHPEYHQPGSGQGPLPVGQGIAAGVGMAMGRKWHASRCDRRGGTVWISTCMPYAGVGWWWRGHELAGAALPPSCSSRRPLLRWLITIIHHSRKHTPVVARKTLPARSLSLHSELVSCGSATQAT